MNALPLYSTPEHAHTLSLSGVLYDVFVLIRMTNHIEPVLMATADLEKELLGEDCWEDSLGKKFSPRELFQSYKNFNNSWELVRRVYVNRIDHIEKVERADYSFPVLRFRDQVIDGTHRIIKALVEGVLEIPVRNLVELPSEAVLSGQSFVSACA